MGSNISTKYQLEKDDTQLTSSFLFIQIYNSDVKIKQLNEFSGLAWWMKINKRVRLPVLLFSCPFFLKNSSKYWMGWTNLGRQYADKQLGLLSQVKNKGCKISFWKAHFLSSSLSLPSPRPPFHSFSLYLPFTISLSSCQNKNSFQKAINVFRSRGEISDQVEEKEVSS